MSKRRRVNKSLLKKKQKYIVDRGLFHEMYDHVKKFNTKRDAFLTELEESEGLMPEITPGEAKTFRQANKPRKEVLDKIAVNKLIDVGKGPTLQWFNQFIPMMVLERNIRKLRLWASGNTYIITEERETGLLVSTEFEGKEAAMDAYKNDYLRFIKFVPFPPSPG